MNSNKKYKYIIFDFDGTINNTSPGIYSTFTKTLAHFGVDAKNVDLSEHIGPPLSYSYAELLGEELIDEAIAFHCKTFAEDNAAQNSFLYEGITEVLEKLVNRGYKLYIASSKYEPHAVESLKYHKISQYFCGVYGQTETRGYKAEVIRQLVEKEGLDKNLCLMIGDTLHDLNGAKDNGIDAAAVSYGFGKTEALKSAQPIVMFDSCREILGFLN